jgi:hypothetical protein
MSFHLTRRGQHHARLPVERQPNPPDDTRPLRQISLVQDKAAFLAAERARPPLALPAPIYASPRALPAPKPRYGPASLPPLRPMPTPRRPRAAWVPPQATRPAPPPIAITEPALLACPGGRVPDALVLHCGCHRVHTRGATASFQVLHAEAERAGWRRDMLGVWACPPCQEQSGWRAPRTPVLTRPAQVLIEDVASQRVPAWRWRQALKHAHRYLIDTKVLRAVRA